jgi:hypothetical protein
MFTRLASVAGFFSFPGSSPHFSVLTPVVKKAELASAKTENETD